MTQVIPILYVELLFAINTKYPSGICIATFRGISLTSPGLMVVVSLATRSIATAPDDLYSGRGSFLSNLLATFYIFYQGYMTYNSVETAVSHYNKCADFRNNFFNLKKFIVKVKDIVKKDKNIIRLYQQFDQQKIIDSINFLDDKLSYNNISSFGNILLIKSKCDDLVPYFETIVQYSFR